MIHKIETSVLPRNNCIMTKKMEVKELNIEILKSSHSVKIIALYIKGLLLKQKSFGEISILALKGGIGIDYFNKRNMTFEPFVEVAFVRYIF